SEEVKQLDNELEKLRQEIAYQQKLLGVNKEKLNYLNKQQEFTAATEKIELSKGILNSQTIKDITLFQFEQRKDIALEETNIQKELKKLNKDLNLLNRKRKKLTASSPRNIEASVFLDKKENGKTQIRLVYLVNNAGWAPTYNFYAKENESKVKVEFNARIQQLSGENWNNVQLNLSNATPALSAFAPGLSPFRLSLSPGEGNVGNASSGEDLKTMTKNLSKQMKAASKKQLEAKSWKETEESTWEMNQAANEFQNLELIAKGEDLGYLRSESLKDTSSPSVNYTLSSPVSLSSKRDQQLIKVNSYELNSNFYNVATPLLTSYVFKESEIENTSSETILEGPVSAYLDGRFVGKGEVSNVAVGQTFIMGFGIDTQIRAKRELIDKKEKILGGNKELTFNVRIILENFYKKPMQLRILDRIPAEDEKDNIRITLDLKGNNLSTDELYTRYERPKGLLRWDLELEPESSAAKSKLLEYKYKLEFDKNLSITLPSNQKNDQMKTEF
ncbi:MAG: DUF4139 domain-containing protein, partial [Leptospiraceae bacterium]|nr:DUF4139 domain-containing protein [Leptospiraceae bacterium]